MKPKFLLHRHSIGLALAASLFVVVNNSKAQSTYYWDNNSTTSGFGTAGGTWGTDAFWTTDDTGAFGVAGITSPTTSDALNFGNDVTGLADGTITVNGTVNSGNMTFASGSGAITLSGGTIDLSAAPTITVNNTTNTIGSAISGAGTSLTKAGTGSLVLSGGGTMAGNVIVSAGTVQLGADNGISTSAGLEVFPSNTVASRTLDLAGFDQTLSRFVFNGSNISGNLTITGGANSKLTINATANNEIGPAGAMTADRLVTVDMSALGGFEWSGATNIFRIGVRSGTSSNSSSGVDPNTTITLASDNTITAATLAIGIGGASTNGGTSILRLGQTNTLNASTINIGTSGRSNATLGFNTGLTDPTATIRGTTGGTSRVTTWDVGNVSDSSNTSWLATADFSAGQLDALVGTLRVGRAATTFTARRGTQTSNFNMGKGTLDVTTLILGQYAGTQSLSTTAGSVYAANGTFTLNDELGTVTAENIILADNVGTNTLNNTTVNVSGIFNLTAGTLEAKTIGKGADTGNANGTITRNFNFTSGTIRNYPGFDLSIANLPINFIGSGPRTFEAAAGQSIALATTTTVSGTGGLTKTGAGTLSLQGSNSYTGPTDVQAGTLAISNSFPNGSTFTVDAAATLELADVTLIVQPALDIDGTLNLTGPVKVGGPLNAIPGTLSNVLQYGSITGAANLGHIYRSASFTVGATSADLDVEAGKLLTWTGDGGNSWDVNTTTSWEDASNTPEKFLWADSVIFDSVGSDAPNVNLAAEMQAASVTVNEATTDYVFSGPGFISGPAGLTKNGAAKLTIETGNTNTGTTTINAGTVEIGSGGTTGSIGSGDIVNNGTLVFNRSNDIAVANAISGTGSVTKLGAGTLTVTGSNSYAGGTNLQAGTLSFASGALGTTGNITFTGNSTLRWETGNTEDISSRLVMTDGVTSIFNTNGNNVTLASGFGGSSTGALTKTGAGTLELSGTNTYSGLTTIASGGGTLRITNKDAIGTGNVRIATAGTNTGTLELALTGTNSINNTFNGFSSANNLGSGNAQILNTSGNNTITSNLTITSTGGNGLNVASNGGLLTLAGNITHTITSIRTLNLGGSGDGVVSGNILNNTGPVTPVTLALTKTGGGTWTLTGANDYTGNTTVNGGTLVLGANNVLPDNSNVVIGAGTLNAATFDDAAGTLRCSAAGTINLGAGSTLAFLDSSAVDWTGGSLTITGAFVPGNNVDPGVGTNPGSLRFGTTNAGLTIDQLASISAPGWTDFALDDYGYLTATAVAGGYATWASANGAGANLNDDHDNDGVDNGVEYFLGGPNGNTTGFTALPGVTNTGGVLSITWTKASDYTGTYGTDFVVETSDSLGGTWTTETSSPGNVTISGNNVTYTFPSPLGSKRFARLKVTGP